MAEESDSTLALNNEEAENAQEILSLNYLSLESCLNGINLAIQDWSKIGLEMISYIDNPTVQEEKQKLIELQNTQEELRVTELLRLSKASCKDENIMTIIKNQDEMVQCLIDKGRLLAQSFFSNKRFKVEIDNAYSEAVREFKAFQEKLRKERRDLEEILKLRDDELAKLQTELNVSLDINK
jgi:hypothetical protein